MPRTTSLLIIAVLVLLEHGAAEHGAAHGPVLPLLGRAGDFVILAKAGITNAGDTNVEQSEITGNIGVYPGEEASLTGFALAMDTSSQNEGQFATSAQQVNGSVVYAANYAEPTPDNLKTAIGDMDLAYNTIASSAACAPDCTHDEHDLHGLLPPGLYKWDGAMTTSEDVKLKPGGVDDTWIFHSAGDVNIAANTRVDLGDAKAENIFWVIAGAMTVGENAHLEGIVIVKSAATFTTGASLHGRLLAETVTLQKNNITQPESAV
jgi:hypothetical protein